jgi:hypothetical protein
VFMPNRLKRASFVRLAVGLAVLAFPLLGAGVAQAAIAGAIPSTTTVRPDIRSASIDPFDPLEVHVCFDKTLNSLISPPLFAVGGYRAGRLVPAVFPSAVDPSNTNCVLVFFNPATAGPDLVNYTFVSVAGGAVLSNAGLHPNLQDSVGLTGSTSHSGTIGTTVAPNLVGVLPPTGTNQVTSSLTFIFDKATHAPTGAGFFFETAAGNICFGIPVPAAVLTNDGTAITVVFNDFPCGGVVDAVRAGIFGGNIWALADPAATNPNLSATLPNCASPCSTQRPDLLSATIDPGNSDQIIYTFDQNVVKPFFGFFEAQTATGRTIIATGAQCNGGTTCTAQFSGFLSRQVEYAVSAWVGAGAVTAADNISPTGTNLPGAAPIGDNAGAFARGFTTGPDVFGVNINKSTGEVTADVDSRVIAVAPSFFGHVTLLSNTGGPIAAGYTASFNASAPAGPSQVQFTYPPSVLTNATQVQFLGGSPFPFGGGFPGAFTSPLLATPDIGLDSTNVSQIVGTVPSGAILRAYNARHVGRLVHKSHHSNKKHHSKRH